MAQHSVPDRGAGIEADPSGESPAILRHHPGVPVPPPPRAPVFRRSGSSSARYVRSRKNPMGFAYRFGVNGCVGDVCTDDHDAFFTETLPIIDRACEDFVFF